MKELQKKHTARVQQLEAKVNEEKHGADAVILGFQAELAETRRGDQTLVREMVAKAAELVRAFLGLLTHHRYSDTDTALCCASCAGSAGSKRIGKAGKCTQTLLCRHTFLTAPGSPIYTCGR